MRERTRCCRQVDRSGVRGRDECRRRPNVDDDRRAGDVDAAAAVDSGDRRRAGDGEAAADSGEVDRSAGGAGESALFRVTLSVPPWSMSMIWPVPDVRDVGDGERADRAAAVRDVGAGGVADVDARDIVVLGDVDAVAGRGVDGRPDRAGGVADQDLVVEQVDPVRLGIDAGAGAREQMDGVPGLRAAQRALRRVERGDRGERIGGGAEIGAADRAVVDIPDGLRADADAGAGDGDGDVLGDGAAIAVVDLDRIGLGAGSRPR